MRQAILTFAFLLNVLIFNTLAAQNTAHHVPGDLLVSLRSDASPEHLAERLNQIWVNNSPNFIVVKKVADPMNIWLFHSDLVDENDELRMLELVRQQPGVAVAQFNHVVENRGHFDPIEFSKEMEAAQKELFSKRKMTKMLSTTPNDPGFAQQWQYINDGSGGGTVDADTDIELAWDVTTGGLTPDGDTIVVCVVDGGVNINHPDLAANIWKNYAEIPGNGIDDDQNGYPDDFRGWSTYANNDNITTNAGHGTPVSGIIGAVGNNGVGVAGVSWNVKIMVVAGGGNEANVLSSYAYPYLFRKKYNETNGQTGAFVVATNSSWGTDFGQPADAPLWCAFYDTLGKVGILSCGATINGNQDVDVVGDLPTACPSDFLISVTNCGRTGKKVTAAGYGLTTIDLGSFGENAWTLSTNNYAGFGGTSGATPHVAGTVGLLYSAPCPGFLALAKADPAQAVLNLKKYILDGVKPEATLAGKTVTGGRLNIDQAMKNLMTNCSSCPTPFSVNATSVTDSSALVFFQKIDTAAVVNLRYQVAGTGVWTVKNAAISPILLENLDPCTFYEVETEMVCADSTSGWSTAKSFKTDGCCDPVANLAVSDLTNSGATISWSPVTAATGYHIQIGIPGIPVLYDIPNYPETTFYLTDAQPCLEFTITVSTICDGSQEIPAAPIVFKTKGCGICEEAPYCANAGGNASEEWIESVEFSDLLHQNVANSPGYLNLIGESATVEQYHVYPIKLTPGFPGGAFNEYFRAWIDWDQNGQFDDATERVFDSGTAAQVPVSTDVLVGNVPVGTARLRVAMKYTGVNGSKPLPCTSFQYGQVKDFCVEIKAGQPECAPPVSINLLAKTDTSATLQWPAVPFATEYLVKINKKGELTFEEFTVATNQILLKNLSICTEYEVKIRPKCGTVEQPLETYFLFKTECGVATGNLPELAGIFIAPNPFSEKLTISLFAEKSGEASLEMFSTNGQLIENQQVAFSAGENRFFLKTEKLAAGIYFIKIKTADGVAVRRVVKG